MQLTHDEVEDLVAALNDEFLARATYTQVIADFGEVRPFSNIIRAEQRHIDALLLLFDRYGIEVPEDPWQGRVPHYHSLLEACRAGVEAEMENAALYDRLLAGTSHADLLSTYRNLQRASQENHLPAFQRCAERANTDDGQGRGRGGGRGMGGRDGMGRGRGDQL